MKLSDVFTQLTVGELSQMSVGGLGLGAVQPSDYFKLIPHVNLGLSLLYQRFNLKVGQLTLGLSPGLGRYTLTDDYAVSSRRSREPIRYIKDSLGDPFENDVLKVEKVITDGGYHVPLNDWDEAYSCTTPTSTQLSVPLDIVDQVMDLPDCLKTVNLRVVYRAKHPQIVQGLGYFDPARVDVDLPSTHLEPLLLFIASRMNNPIGMTNEHHAGNSYMAKYEAACKRLENDGLEIDRGSSNHRLRRNGWV